MAEDEYRNGRHVVYKLRAHLIFVTKYRKKVMTDRECQRHSRRLRNRPRPCSPPRVLPAESRFVNAGHLTENDLVDAGPRPPLARGSQSPLGNHFWSPSYFVMSCDGAPLDVIRAYVRASAPPTGQRTDLKSKA